MVLRFLRRAGALCAILAAILTLSATAAFGATYNKNLVLSNANMRDASSLTAAQVQAFLSTKNGVLKSKSFPRHDGGATASAAQIIWEASNHWGVSPKVMLTMLQKEQSLIEQPTTNQSTFDWAIGMGVPDGSPRNVAFQGFGNQLWYGAMRLDGYGELKAGVTYIDKYYPGITEYMPPGVVPANLATFKLYVYNPSVTGNYNFWAIYNKYFGDPNGGDTIPPTTSATVAASYDVISTIRLVATDNIGGKGVAHTYYKADNGATQEGTGVNVRTPGSHTVEYWSVDRATNEEVPHHTATFSVVAAAANMQPVYRFYNRKNGSHFYTASGAECDTVVATLWNTYSLDGVAYSIDTSNANNTSPLFRFYNKKLSSHFYTASTAERDNVISKLGATYSYDGPAYSISTTDAASAMPVYRFYNLKNGDHFYTSSAAERDSVLATLGSTYRLEGTAFWVAP